MWLLNIIILVFSICFSMFKSYDSAYENNYANINNSIIVESKEHVKVDILEDIKSIVANDDFAPTFVSSNLHNGLELYCPFLFYDDENYSYFFSTNARIAPVGGGICKYYKQLNETAQFLDEYVRDATMFNGNIYFLSEKGIEKIDTNGEGQQLILSKNQYSTTLTRIIVYNDTVYAYSEYDKTFIAVE